MRPEREGPPRWGHLCGCHTDQELRGLEEAGQERGWPRRPPAPRIRSEQMCLGGGMQARWQAQNSGLGRRGNGQGSHTRTPGRHPWACGAGLKKRHHRGEVLDLPSNAACGTCSRWAFKLCIRGTAVCTG